MNINCTIRVFFDCLKGDYSHLPGGAPAFAQLYHGFTELSYLKQSQISNAKFERVKLQGQQSFLITQIQLCQKSFEKFREPFWPALKTLQAKGYKIDFSETKKEKFLSDIETLGKKISSEFQAQIDVLTAFIDHVEVNGLPMDHFTETYFVKGINLLRSKGCKIDSNKTTVKELALMIRG